MFSKRNLGKIFVTASLILTLSACGGSGGGGGTLANSQMAGLWIEEGDRETISYLKQEDGSCSPYKVSDASDLGNFYLQLIKIENNGNIMDLSVVNKDSMPEGDFYHKWTISEEGNLYFSETFKNTWNSKLQFKEYKHKMSMLDENTIESHIVKSITVYEGQETTTENVKNLFYRITQEEFKQIMVFAKDCATKQTID